MGDLETIRVACPYCGEINEIEIESLEEKQAFIEDCRVCCRPIQLEVTQGEDGWDVTASRSN